MADLTTAMTLQPGTQLSFGLAPGGGSLGAGGGAGGTVWVSPACRLAVSWGPKSDPTLRGAWKTAL